MEQPDFHDLTEIEHWAGISLEDLRQSAVLEESGIAFEAMKKGGVRRYLIVCFTGEDLIGRVMRDLGVRSAAEHSNWSEISLLQAVSEGIWTSGSAVRILTDPESGVDLAVAVASAEAGAIREWEERLGI